MGYICDPNDSAKIAGIIKKFWNDISISNFSVEFNRSPFTIKFTLKEEGKDVAGFTLIEMVNCCGILVSTKTFVRESHRKRGIAQGMMYIKEELARTFGYSSMMATVNITGNPAEVHILEKMGWTNVNQFKNSRTKNTVGVFTKNL